MVWVCEMIVRNSDGSVPSEIKNKTREVNEKSKLKYLKNDIMVVFDFDAENIYTNNTKSIYPLDGLSSLKILVTVR